MLGRSTKSSGIVSEGERPPPMGGGLSSDCRHVRPYGASNSGVGPRLHVEDVLQVIQPRGTREDVRHVPDHVAGLGDGVLDTVILDGRFGVSGLPAEEGLSRHLEGLVTGGTPARIVVGHFDLLLMN